MSDPSHPGDRSPSEIADYDRRIAEAATIVDQQAEAAETMEDNQRLLFETSQRAAEIEAAEE